MSKETRRNDRLLKFGTLCTESYSERGVIGEYVSVLLSKRIRDFSNENSIVEVQIVVGRPG